MHVDLITTTKGSPKIIHGTENGKKTACGINLTKPENIGQFTSTGTMSDVIQMTCEKCKTVIAKKLIREANKEMAAQLKEEQKQLKRERAASKHQHEDAVAVPPPPMSTSNDSGGYIPPSMRKSMQEQQQQKPIDAPPAAPPTPASIPAPPPVAAPTPAVSAPADDVLSQFNVPTSLPGMTPPAPTPVPAPVPAAPPAPAAPAHEDVLSQFAIPAVPTAPASAPMPAPTPEPAPAQNDDVLSQFAIPTVPTAPPPMTPAQDDVLAQFAVPSVPPARPEPVNTAPAAVPTDDVLAQFAIPSVPGARPVTTPKAALAADADDLLAQFSIPNPTVPTEQSVPELNVKDAPPVLGNATAQRDDILAQFSINPPASAPAEDLSAVPTVEAEIDESKSADTPILPNSDAVVEVNPVPAPNDYNPFEKPVAEVKQTAEELLDELLLMPGAGSNQPQAAQPLPDLTTVPTAAPAPAPAPVIPQAAPPAAEIPVQPVPQMPVPPVMQQPVMPQGYPMPNMPQNMGYAVPQAPVYPQGYGQIPPQQGYPAGYPQPVPGYPAPQPNLFTPPTPAKSKEPDTPTPLFVGYGADGRQIFQTYDALGNPVPINEPVYSSPPEQSGNAPMTAPNVLAAAMASGNAAPVMDMDELMAQMGIEDPSKKKVDEGKAINYTEYKIPDKKNKKPAAPKKPAAKQSEPTGPVSAAEAKRRKKVDKINKEFEKQLRSRGIDPKTGGIMMDKK